jgi:hypothetical protein
MSMGKRPAERQPELFVASRDLARSPGHPSTPPGVYFRFLVVGYFEGIGHRDANSRASGNS